jgi:hypothetical protein
MILILIFAEALALYGLIGKKDAIINCNIPPRALLINTDFTFVSTVGIILASKAGSSASTTPAA